MLFGLNFYASLIFHLACLRSPLYFIYVCWRFRSLVLLCDLEKISTIGAAHVLVIFRKAIVL
jgi:uncharacterized membrane protein YhdT